MNDAVSNHHVLRGRKILLGVTAGIAAYKAAELARLLIKQGAQVRVVMTPSATQFVGGLTFQAITGEAVRDSLFDPAHEAAMGHIELARWAELILVAPASADFIAKLRAGMADTLLHTLCLASTAPLALAPAMNGKMWENPATASNVAALQAREVAIWGPDEGQQACGDTGVGRLLEPTQLLAHVVRLLAQPISNEQTMAGCRVVLTAGPTREALDAVRFFGNRSSGKMGYALARALLRAGAEVTLVSGPVALEVPKGVRLVPVESALQMHAEVMQVVHDADVFIACAAVADYRPAQVAAQKIKKQAQALTIELIQNPDILHDVARLPDAPFCVGFAAETQDLAQYAEKKRRAKGVDMIAANQVGAQQGFEVDENALLVLWEGGSRTLPQQSKEMLARQLVSLIADRFHAKAPVEGSGSATWI